MKVEGPRPIENLRSSRGRTAVGHAGTFAPEMPAEPPHAAPVSGAVSVSSVDALIALQEVPDAMRGRAKAARRGRDMLDLLDDLRDGILEGGVSKATLTRLLALVNVKREEFADPGLSGVLDEIELRARVELAKLNFGD